MILSNYAQSHISIQFNISLDLHCPSDACWHGVKGECVLTEDTDCITTTCTAGWFSSNITSDVFGIVQGDRPLYINGVETEECTLQEWRDGNGELVLSFHIPLGACEMTTNQMTINDVSQIKFGISISLHPMAMVGDMVGCEILKLENYVQIFRYILEMEQLLQTCFVRTMPWWM